MRVHLEAIPLLCKANGPQYKGFQIGPQLVDCAMQIVVTHGKNVKRSAALAGRTLPSVRSLLSTFVVPATTSVCQK
jgi:hypothetical protein